jgi:hypothetical protein
MSSHRLTRRRFIVAGAASAAGVGAAGAGFAAETASGDDIVVGRFVRPKGPRAGVVSIERGDTVSVSLDSGAFVAHGADGVVDDLRSFVPGEQVVVRGARAGGAIAAVEFQSVYTSVTGTFASDEAGHWLVTSSGERVHVPENVLQRHAPAGIARGQVHKATIWTDPATGAATAVDVSDD